MPLVSTCIWVFQQKQLCICYWTADKPLSATTLVYVRFTENRLTAGLWNKLANGQQGLQHYSGLAILPGVDTCLGGEIEGWCTSIWCVSVQPWHCMAPSSSGAKPAFFRLYQHRWPYEQAFLLVTWALFVPWVYITPGTPPRMICEMWHKLLALKRKGRQEPAGQLWDAGFALQQWRS